MSRAPQSRRPLARIALAGALIGLGSAALAGPAHAEELRVSTGADPQPGDCRPADCTLREAVIEANSDADEDVILLRPRLTYRLELDGAGEQEARTGDLDLTEPVRVLATGKGRARVDAGGIDRVFDLYAPATLEGLVLTGGLALGSDGGQGAAVRAVSGRLAVRDSRLVANRGPSSALELLGDDGATIRDSAVSGNVGAGVIDRGGGGLRAAHTRINANGATGLQGFGPGSLVVYHGEISDNGLRGIEDFDEGDVAAVDVSIARNGAEAIDEQGEGGLYVRRSRLRDNRAGVSESGGGELSVYRTRLTGSDDAAALETGTGGISFIKSRLAYNGGLGVSEFDEGSVGLEETALEGSPDGGVVERGDGNIQLTLAKVLDSGGIGLAELDAGDVGMVRSRITGAEDVGLTLAEGSATLLRTRVIGNGGGIAIAAGSLGLGRSAVVDNAGGLGGITAINADVSLRQSTVGRNRSERGAGGVDVGGAGSLTASNSTVAENRSDAGPGGIGLGPAAEADLNAVTIAANTSAAGDGGGIVAAPGAGATIDNSLLVANRLGPEPSDCAGDGLLSGGGNAIGSLDPAACGALGGPGDAVVGQARVAPLGPNGGPTSTVALRRGSPAIGAAGPDAPARDQRSVRRRDPDAGAFEYRRR